MPRRLNTATVGARVRKARKDAGLTQAELGQRIGASRFWVAEFEKGKATVELGLALKALHALGLVVRIETRLPAITAAGSAVFGLVVNATGEVGRPAADDNSQLDAILANATDSAAAPSSVAGWPTSAKSEDSTAKS